MNKTQRLTSIEIYYPKADSRTDAVARLLHEMSASLARVSSARVVVIPEPRLPPGLKRNWAFYEFLYLAWAAIDLARRGRRKRIIITVDVPIGLAAIGRLAHLWSAGRIQHIAYVLDDYHYMRRRALSVRRLLLALMLAIDKSAMRRAQACVTIGICMKKRLGDKGIRSEVVPLWPIGMTEMPSPTIGHQSDSSRRPYFFYGGHAGPRHPLHVVVKAAALLQEFDFYIRADGVAVEELKRLVNATKSTNISFLPRMTAHEFREVAGAAAAHLVSLDADATGSCVPSKAYDAMALGVPIAYMGDPAGQAARDIEEANCGIIVPHDGVLLANALRQLGTPNKDYGARGLAFQRQYRTAEGAAESWLGILQSLQAKSGHATR